MDLALIKEMLPDSSNLIENVVNWEENVRFLDIKIVNVSDLIELIIRYLMNSGVVFLIVHFMYARASRRKDFYFSYLAIGSIVFLLCFLLGNVKLELGFALGLFAIFGIIRYRTSTIPIKEMTYLFIIIGISVINALSNKKVSYTELVFTNAVVIGGLWLLEKILSLRQEISLTIVYENIENINILNKKNLLKDLKKRTGIDIKRFQIKKIDFARDIADITVYYENNHKSPDEEA